MSILNLLDLQYAIMISLFGYFVGYVCRYLRWSWTVVLILILSVSRRGTGEISASGGSGRAGGGGGRVAVNAKKNSGVKISAKGCPMFLHF